MKNKVKLPTRNAADPYKIALTGQPYILTKEMLIAATDERVRRKRNWYSTDIHYISTENGVLQLSNRCREQHYNLTVTIRANELLLSCSCGESVETLCEHSYKALDRLTSMGATDFFKQYRENALADMAKKYSRYFITESTSLGLQITPHPDLGTLYQLSRKLDKASFDKIKQLPALPGKQPAVMKDTVLTYLLVCPFRDRFQPCIIPCLGKLNKAGTQLKQFDKFASGAQPRYEECMSAEQKMLNTLSFEIYRIAEKLPGRIDEDSTEQELTQLQSLYGLWQKAVPFLQNQTRVYSYLLHREKQLKEKPSRKKATAIEIRTESPELQFCLTDRGDIVQLHMEVVIKGKLIKPLNPAQLFFIIHENAAYLLASLKDACLLKWMQYRSNCISLLKKSTAALHQRYWNPYRNTILSDLKRAFL